jgi:phage gp29-like protein
MGFIKTLVNRVSAARAKLATKGGRVTMTNSKSEPYSQLELLDADRLQMILRSAIGGGTRWLFALYRDMILSSAHIQTELAKRKLAVLGDVMTVTPLDKTLPADVAAGDFCRQQINALAARQVKLQDSERVVQMTSWRRACSHLLDSCLWPVSVLEKVFEPDGAGYRLAELVPVPYHLLDYSAGYLRIQLCDPDGSPLGEFVNPDPDRYIVHRGHLLTSPDNFGGPMRSLVWLWLLSTMSMEWWGRFLDRYGAPFLVGKYEQNDEVGRNTLERAFGFAVRIGGLVVSENTEVELKETARGGEAGYVTFISHCQGEMSKLILGQTLSATATSTGLGSGVATLQAEVRDDIRKFDAIMLAETLRDQLLTQLCQINGLPGNPPKLIWGSESPEELTATGNLLKTLYEAGVEVDDPGLQALSDRAGLPMRRRATPAANPFPAAALAALGATFPFGDLDAVAVAGSADLAQAFRGPRAALARIIRESTSADDCERKIKAFSAHLDVGRQAVILEQALAAYTANGISSSKFATAAR